MAEHHAKTDLEVRFEMFKKQYHDRQAEAKRTGKPIPAHTQRWYDKQIEEYRTSLKRLGLIMTLSMPTVAEAVERDRMRDPALVTAAMLTTEAFIADAIESGEIDAKEQKLCAHSIRMAQSHLTQEERKRLNHRRAEKRRQDKRNADRLASLTSKIVEPGWAERAIETDQELRGLFDDYIARSVNSTVWYKVTHNIPHTADDVAAIKAQRTFLLLLNLNADHGFLHRLDQLRKESLRRSGEKQWALIKNNPERYEQYKRDAAEAYAKKQAKRIKMGVEAISDDIASQAVFDHWAAVYEVARKNARKI